MMFRPYLFAFSALFLGVSSEIAASDWTKAKNEFRTTVGLNHTNNLLMSAEQKESAQHMQVGLQYDWLGLYEGFGVYLPATITSRHYREYSELNDQDYQFSPALKLFLAEAADVTFESQLQRQHLIAGIGSAEFLDPSSETSVRSEQKRLALALQLGRQPDRQNLAFRLGTERNQLQSQHSLGTSANNLLINQLDSDFLRLDYGHRVSENTSILANVEMRQEQQRNVESDIQQVGAGFLQQWSGAQQLRIVVGYFQRESAAQENSGSFWQIENAWQLSESWQLLLRSERLSVLSYATDSISQQDTTYQAQLLYAFSDPHVLKLQFGRRTSQLDEQLLHRKRQELTLGWDWQISQDWQSQLSLNHFRRIDNAQTARSRFEIFWQLSWLW
jgi:hypothetical protein